MYTHKKTTIFIVLIIVGILMIVLENLLYTPVQYDYPTRDSYSQSYESYRPAKRPTSCHQCYGVGSCYFCDGSGIIRQYGQTVECTSCRGYGICYKCHGTGEY